MVQIPLSSSVVFSALENRVDDLEAEFSGLVAPAPIVWRGDWVTATSYHVGDGVQHTGSSYVCLIAHTSGTFATDLAASKWQIIAEKGDPGTGGDYETASNLATIDAVISHFGSSDLPVLHDANISVTATKVLPDNAAVLSGGGEFVGSGSRDLTFQGPGFTDDSLDERVTGFPAGKIKWIGKYPEFFRPEWFGIVSGDASASTANDAARAVMMEALKSYQSLVSTQINGAKIKFSNDIYYFDTGFPVNTQCVFEGVPGTVIKIGANSYGFRVNNWQTEGDASPLDTASFITTGSNASTTSPTGLVVVLATPLPADFTVNSPFWYTGGTLPAPVGGVIFNISSDRLTVSLWVMSRTVDGGSPVAASTGVTFRAERHRQGNGTIFRNLVIQGTAGSTTHNITLNGLTVTRHSGGNFDITDGYNEGYTFTKGTMSYVIDAVTNANTLTIKPFVIRVSDYAPNTYLLPSGLTAPSEWIGATVSFPGLGTTTITGVGATITTVANYVFSGTLDVSITSFPVANFTNVDVRFNRWPGIWANEPITVENVTVEDFPGHGFQFDTGRSITSIAPGTSPNTNLSVMDQPHAYRNYGAGVYCKGVNSNAMVFSSVDVQSNRIGIFDNAYYPNVYNGFHSSDNIETVIAGGTGSLQGPIFNKPYIEGGWPEFNVGPHTYIGTGTYTFGKGGGYQEFVQNGFKLNTGIDSRSKTTGLGSVTAGKTIFFRTGTLYSGVAEFGETDSAGNPSKSYQLVNFVNGLFGWAYYGPGESPLATGYDPVMEYSTSDHAIGGNQIGFPKGFYAKTKVVAKTAAYTLTAFDSNRTFTNEGTTARMDFTLPTAAAGLVYRFIVQDTDGIRVIADTGDTIRNAGSVSATAGRIDNATIGSVVTIEAINATEWIVTSFVGTWVVT